jgi:hypothetical protein
MKIINFSNYKLPYLINFTPSNTYDQMARQNGYLQNLSLFHPCQLIQTSDSM